VQIIERSIPGQGIHGRPALTSPRLLGHPFLGILLFRIDHPGSSPAPSALAEILYVIPARVTHGIEDFKPPAQ